MLKKVLLALAVLLILGAGIAYYLRNSIFTPNVKVDSYELFIVEGTDYASVLDQLKADDVLIDAAAFDLVSRLMRYQKTSVPAGRYIIKSGMSNRQLVGKLRAGNQDAIKVVFNNLRTIPKLAGQLSSNILLDSIAILNALNNPELLTNHGVTKEGLMSLFIPNTYEYYWDVSAEDLLQKLITEGERFWKKEDRMTKLEALGMTKNEVYTLASIVEKESNNKAERPTVAGVYLNRVERGIPLQADPTVVFAVGDFSIRRVLNKHLKYESPYNTYINQGLPPGPIYMPSINSIDAVLANEDHDYIFFCAKPGYNSGHLFAKNNAQHSANARKYHKWLSSENIR